VDFLLDNKQRPRWPSPEEQQANAETRFMIQVGWKSRWLWINTYDNNIFMGMNIHKSQLFLCSPGVQGFDTLPFQLVMSCIVLGILLAKFPMDFRTKTGKQYRQTCLVVHAYRKWVIT
jgi:hypothetical protein